jgi:hypothetical protein
MIIAWWVCSGAVYRNHSPCALLHLCCHLSILAFTAVTLAIAVICLPHTFKMVTAPTCNDSRLLAPAGLLHLQPSHPEGLVSLKGYIAFWGWVFTALTLAIAFLKQEEDHLADSAAAAAAADSAAAAVDEKEEDSQLKKRPAAANVTGRVKSKGSSKGSVASDAADAQCLLTNGSAAAAVMVEAAAGGDDWSSRWQEIRAAYVQLWEVVSSLREHR